MRRICTAIIINNIILQAICPFQTIQSLSSSNTNANKNSHKNNQQPIHTLLLCRHGNSIWNGGQPGTQETFTGWTDVPLSQKGIVEARNTAAELALYSYGIDACFTSILGRARETAHCCCWALAEKPQSVLPMRYVSDYRLNERHYGALQGYVKSHVEQGLHGHDYESVQAWRRSWYAIPPLLEDEDPRRIKELKYNSNICGGDKNVPRGESLEMVAKNRIRPFIDEVLHPMMNAASNKKKEQIQSGVDIDAHKNKHDSTRSQSYEYLSDNHGGCGLVVAHANSLRALIGVICQVEESPSSLKKLESMKIETGVPLILQYRQLEDGSYEACDLLVEIDVEDQLSKNTSPDLPVWPLSCIPKRSIEQGQFQYSKSTEREKESAMKKRKGANKIRIDVI